MATDYSRRDFLGNVATGTGLVSLLQQPLPGQRLTSPDSVAAAGSTLQQSSPALQSVPQPARYDVKVELEQNYGKTFNIPKTPDSLRGKVKSNPQNYELRQVTADEVRQFYQGLVDGNVVPDLKPAEAYLDGVIAHISNDPNFLSKMQLAIGERRGNLIQFSYLNSGADRPLVYGKDEYFLNLTFTGIQEGDRVKPINLDSFDLFKKNPFYGFHLGPSWERVTVTEPEYQKSLRLVPLKDKEEGLIWTIDFMGRRAKILRALQKQNIPLEVIKGE